jgi:mono/diheme cytochrome c family protein
VNSLFRRPEFFAWPLLLTVSLSGIGCDQPEGPEFRLNRVELLKQERMVLPTGESFQAGQLKELQLALIVLFGTPNEPRFPGWASKDSQPVSLDSDHPPVQGMDQGLGEQGMTFVAARLDRAYFQPKLLRQAAGVVSSDEQGIPSGLYREHCAQCHGLAGDGTGSTAGFLDPYPRDFRLGKFKFKSTPLRQAPTHQDMLDLLRRGIPGTAMPSFRNLPEEHLEALADYVRYLTVRGQFERYLIGELARLDGRPLLVRSVDARIRAQLAEGNPDSVQKLVATLSDSQLQAIAREAIEIVGEDLLVGLIERWYLAEQRVTPVPEPPPAFAEGPEGLAEWVDAGFTLFLEKGNCGQCHVVGMLKSNSLDNFDDWTSDWVKTLGVDPTQQSSFRDFVKAGALPPRTVRPRILDLGVMRGGDGPQQIYRRIANGIEGTPMPSAPTLSSEEIWALVAYVQSLSGAGSQTGSQTGN